MIGREGLNLMAFQTTTDYQPAQATAKKMEEHHHLSTSHKPIGIMTAVGQQRRHRTTSTSDLQRTTHPRRLIKVMAAESFIV
jgi:hypothetical protein